MDIELCDYMSREEREQMDALMDRARRRKERREEAAIGAKRFQFFQCQCACKMEMDGGLEKEPRKSSGEEMEQMLKAICDFCLKYDLCQCPYHRADRQMQEWQDKREKEEMDELEEMLTGELPL